ncbi:mCG146826 [Mus musculus]|nr:mCG146826 [Mus musculus]
MEYLLLYSDPDAHQRSCFDSLDLRSEHVCSKISDLLPRTHIPSSMSSKQKKRKDLSGKET